MNLKKKVLAVDIDGTLVTPDKIITRPTLEAIARFQDAGGILILASGRPPCGMQPYVEQLNMVQRGGYVLAYNGSLVMETKTGKIAAQRFLDRGQLPAIVEIAGRFGIYPMTYEGDTAVIENDSDPYYRLEVSINGLKSRVVDSLVDYVQFPLPKCLCTGAPAVLEQLAPAFEAGLTGVNVFRSEPFFLEVNPMGIGKGEILKELLEEWGYTAADLMAVGDGYNDITMLRYASLGVAMGNAREETKQAANAVTASNCEDGLAAAINEFLFD